jgi:hypothetical protein
MRTQFQELCVQFETLFKQLKQARGPKERRAVLCDIADVVLELDALLSDEIESGEREL